MILILWVCKLSWLTRKCCIIYILYITNHVTLLIPCVHSVSAKVSGFFSPKIQFLCTISGKSEKRFLFSEFLCPPQARSVMCGFCRFPFLFFFLVSCFWVDFGPRLGVAHKNPNFVSAVCSEIGRRSSVLWSAVCFLSSYLHSCSPPIIHGNLTCDTIFIQHNGLVKIGSGNHIEKSHEIHFFRKKCVFYLFNWFIFLELLCCIVRDQRRRIVTPSPDLFVSCPANTKSSRWTTTERTHRDVGTASNGHQLNWACEMLFDGHSLIFPHPFRVCKVGKGYDTENILHALVMSEERYSVKRLLPIRVSIIFESFTSLTLNWTQLPDGD